MIDVPEVDKLIAHAMRRGRSKWQVAGFDLTAAARRERVAHVVTELERLGHPTLAAELLRLENLPAPRIDITSVA